MINKTRAVLLLVLALSACAITPERLANRYCGVSELGGKVWTLLTAPPANAEVYRAAEDVEAPGRHEAEFWYRAEDATRLCIIDTRRDYALCSGGYWDFNETADGPVYDDGGQWICVS
jgi:hypothetical protein